MGWNGLPRVDDVDPTTQQDVEVLTAIREVLERYGALNRFGVTLLHSHFDLADDEVLIEKVDPDTRTLTIRPEQLEVTAISDRLLATSWRLDSPEFIAMTATYCWRPPDSVFHAR